MTKERRVNLYSASVVVVSVSTAFYAAAVLQQYVDPLLIWGGSECTTYLNTEIVGCFGYPPTGIIVLLFGAAVFWTGLGQGLIRFKARYTKG